MKKDCNYVGRYISQIHRRGGSFISKELSGLGVGAGQFMFLLELYRGDGRSQEDLAETLNIDIGTTARAIKKLEEELDMLINDKEYSKERVEKAESLKSLGLFADDHETTFAELEIREISYKLGYDNNIKYELMRLASSKWGKRIIKLALKLKLNKLLR